MSLKERLLQQLQGRRKEATPRRIAEAIGEEEISMDRAVRRYPVTDGVLEQKQRGRKPRNTKQEQKWHRSKRHQRGRSRRG